MERSPLRWWALAVMVVAVLMDMVDNQIVTVALPTIRHRLGAGEASLQWISAGYALGFGVTLITGGRLGDRYGRKRLFLWGMAGFTAASLVAGLAPGVGVLIAARVAQGVGSGLMVPQVLSFVQAEFDEDERPRAMACYAAAFPLGGLAGPLLGGLLTQADVLGSGWRAIFLVNLPVGVAAAAGALLTLPARPPGPARRVDPGGLVLLTAALFALFYPLVQGRELGWPWWSAALMAAAVPLAALFARQQRAHARRGGEPLIPPELLRCRGLVAGQAVTFAVNTAVGVFFVISLHMQLGLGWSPLRAALTFLPTTLGIVVGNAVALRAAPRAKRPLTVAAIVTLVASLGAMAALIAWRGNALTPWALLAPALGFGLGNGASLNSLMTLSLSEVGPRHAGAASGVVTTTVQLATATGIALFGTVFFSRLDSGFPAATAQTTAVSTGVLAVALALTAALPRARPADDSSVRENGTMTGVSER
ncbi:MFS transporter [Streptomyces caatingaensis]|uniref:MFS transporter n=1 Tax=Streptomyces caatingaensis TaxID=1678637 RepID=UPI000A5D20EB|nr:MFS transporter [Streptomyces caatingaensis]